MATLETMLKNVFVILTRWSIHMGITTHTFTQSLLKGTYGVALCFMHKVTGVVMWRKKNPSLLSHLCNRCRKWARLSDLFQRVGTSWFRRRKAFFLDVGRRSSTLCFQDTEAFSVISFMNLVDQKIRSSDPLVCSLCFFVTYLPNLHLSPVLRILLCYLESLPFLQSPHHLFALDSTAVCRYWPNKNIAFIIPGGQVIGVDTNIPPLKPNSPAAFSSKTRTNPTPSSLPQS